MTRTSLTARLAGLFGRKPAPILAPPPAPVSRVDETASSSVPQGNAAVAFFRLVAADGQVLTLRGEPAWLGLAAEADAAHAAIAVIPDAMPQICVLVAPDGRAFRVGGDPDAGIAASAVIVRSEIPQVVRLKYPLGDTYLVIGVGDAPERLPALRFDGDGETPAATFGLARIAPQAVPAAARALGGEIGAAAAEGLRGTHLLAALRSFACRQELAPSLLRVMARDELAELGRRVLENPADLAVLRRAMPGDVWLNRHLPGLAAWQTARTPAGDGNTLRSPPEDEAALLPAASSRLLVPAGLALNSLARRAVLPRRGACVLATARNEGAYLLDWVSYHLSIGFDHVFLYTNDNTDGSDELLGLLARHGVITWIRNECGPSMSAQFRCYSHALRMLPQILDYRWTALIDLDEYVSFDTGRYTSIGDFIGQQEVRSVDALGLCWLFFAGQAGDVWSADSTPSRFTRRDPSVNQHIKSLFRPRLFWFSQCHYPVPVLDTPFEFRTPDGGLHHHAGVVGRGEPFAETPSADRAWISHYLLRSAEEALWKWARGQGDQVADSPGRRRPLDFIAGTFLDLSRPECQVEDRRTVDCARHQAGVLDTLLRLPGVAACDARIKAEFGAKLRANTALFLDTELPPDASSSVRAFRGLVAEQQAVA